MPYSYYLGSGLAYKPPNPRPLLALYESKAPQDIRYFDELGDPCASGPLLSDMLFIENDFGRYSFGSTTDGLKTNADGSLDIIIQKDRPEDTSNWLPAPTCPFHVGTMSARGP